MSVFMAEKNFKVMGEKLRASFVVMGQRRLQPVEQAGCPHLEEKILGRGGLGITEAHGRRAVVNGSLMMGGRRARRCGALGARMGGM